MSAVARGQQAVPHFTVMIPTFNRSDSLRRALLSVQRQTFRDFEIVVVDDGSTEDIAAVVRDIAPAAAIIRLERNGGIPDARNAGIKAARGRYIAFLDSDDLWHPRYLQYQRAVNEAVPNAIFTFTNYFSNGLRASGPVQQLVPEPMADNALLHMIMRPFVHTMSCFVALRSSIIMLGGFDPRLRRFSDLDLYVRMLAGRRGRPSLACLERPAPNLPHILALKNNHLEDRSLDDYMASWEAGRRGFLDTVFAYEFMAPFRHLRPVCEERLMERQREFFNAFLAA